MVLENLQGLNQKTQEKGISRLETQNLQILTTNTLYDNQVNEVGESSMCCNTFKHSKLSIKEGNDINYKQMHQNNNKIHPITIKAIQPKLLNTVYSYEPILYVTCY